MCFPHGEFFFKSNIEASCIYQLINLFIFLGTVDGNSLQSKFSSVDLSYDRCVFLIVFWDIIFISLLFVNTELEYVDTTISLRLGIKEYRKSKVSKKNY